MPAALAVTRRVAALAEEKHDSAAVTEATTLARALAIVVGDLDPVAAGRSNRGAVRGALASSIAPPAKKHK